MNATLNAAQEKVRMPVQRRLAINVPVESPLIHVSMVRGILDVDEDEVLDMIGDKISWAWDIGLGKNRAEIRVLTKSARGCKTTGGRTGWRIRAWRKSRGTFWPAKRSRSFSDGVWRICFCARRI